MATSGRLARQTGSTKPVQVHTVWAVTAFRAGERKTLPAGESPDAPAPPPHPRPSRRRGTSPGCTPCARSRSRSAASRRAATPPAATGHQPDLHHDLIHRQNQFHRRRFTVRIGGRIAQHESRALSPPMSAGTLTCSAATAATACANPAWPRRTRRTSHHSGKAAPAQHHHGGDLHPRRCLPPGRTTDPSPHDLRPTYRYPAQRRPGAATQPQARHKSPLPS